MAMSKKGIFFTFAAIVLALIIIISFNAYTTYKLKDKMEPVETRVETMDSFIKDLENDAENAIFIAGFRGLLSLEDYMMKHEKFFDPNGIAAPSRNGAFREAFLYGTITFEGDTEKMPLMENNTFLNWMEKMKVEANKTGIVLELTANDVDIGQSEPWKVDVEVDLGIDAKDRKDIASWTINRVFTGKINITSPAGVFADPLYLINTSGLVNNTIRETTVTDFSTQLPTHLLNSYYREHANNAPSYIMRFENNLGSSPYGIESLVYLPKLEAKGLAIYSKSAVDHIYFGGTNPEKCNINGMQGSYPWFYLDKTVHAPFYSAACYEPT